MAGEAVLAWGENNMPQKTQAWFAIIEKNSWKSVYSVQIADVNSPQPILADCNNHTCLSVWRTAENLLILTTPIGQWQNIQIAAFHIPAWLMTWRGILQNQNLCLIGSALRDGKSQGALLCFNIQGQQIRPAHFQTITNTAYPIFSGDWIASNPSTSTRITGGILFNPENRQYYIWMDNTNNNEQTQCWTTTDPDKILQSIVKAAQPGQPSIQLVPKPIYIKPLSLHVYKQTQETLSWSTLSTQNLTCEP